MKVNFLFKFFMSVIIFMTLFMQLPTVRANIEVDSEFADPVKNWSFEDRDMSIPGDGVFGCPHWETNNEGYRHLGGDIEPQDIGNGKVDIFDVTAAANAYGSTLGSPNWNPYADLNGDGDVDIFDIVGVTGQYGMVQEYAIDGNYSWYANGGAYNMWQRLDDDVVDAVAGQNITFSFWTIPKFIPTGNENNLNQQATSTSGWYMGVDLTHITSTPKKTHVKKIQLDVRVSSGSGYYKITYEKAGEGEHILVPDQLVTNTAYETKEHDVSIWSEEGQSITIRFYIGQYQGNGMIWSRNHYMHYDEPEPIRAEIYYVYGSLALISPKSTFVWVEGDWVYPIEQKWHNVFVNATLPTQWDLIVKVIIRGASNFKGYIDMASLGIISTKSSSAEVFDTEMKLSLAVSLFESKDYSLPVSPCRAFLGVALAANMSESAYWDYRNTIDYIELEVKLIFGDSITIRNITQSNSVNEITDPDQTEEIENTWAAVNNLAIKGLVAAGLWIIAPQIAPLTYNIGNLWLSLTWIGGSSLLLPTYRSDADTPYTDEIGGYAKAKIAYGSWPTFANERGILELAYNSGSSCVIEVTARAKFTAYHIPTGTPVPLATLEDSILIDVSC